MFVFYFLSFLAIYGVLNTLLRKNVVSCAIHLALSMIALAGLFFQLGARFIAGVQLVVYAGAVMVLFVMVLMLFDSKKEESFFPFSRFQLSNFLKAVLCTVMFGLISGNIPHSIGSLNSVIEPQVTKTRDLSLLLFSKYVFLFEWLGLLLLIVAVGVVVLSRGEKDDFNH